MVLSLRVVFEKDPTLFALRWIPFEAARADQRCDDEIFYFATKRMAGADKQIVDMILSGGLR